MSEYYREDISIGLEIEPHIGLLRDSLGGEVTNADFEIKLIYNQRNPEFIHLTIYYTPSDYLFEKLELLKKNGINILSLIKEKYKKGQWEYPEILDFSNSNLIEIQEGHYWEQSKKLVILTIDNVDVLISNLYAGDARFKLTKNIFLHLDDYINYGSLGRNYPDDRFIEANNNRETNFGSIRFILSFEHFREPSLSRQKLSIIREAYLTLTNDSNELTDEQLVEQADILCLLMSFYWEKEIDYFIAKVRVNNIDNYRTKEKLKYSDHIEDNSEGFLLKEKFKTIYDFVESIEYEKLIAVSSLLSEIVPRILKIKNVDEISAFMILYNVIEKIRNFCLLNPVNGEEYKIKEEFNFIKGIKPTYKHIRDKIKEISEIVEQSDVIEFKNKASDKVNFIKKTGLIDQFDSLLFYLKLDSSDYEINFIDLIKTRNDIYHGKLPTENVKPYNIEMKLLIYDMILKMIN
jgi:hypothetical protein